MPLLSPVRILSLLRVPSLMRALFVIVVSILFEMGLLHFLLLSALIAVITLITLISRIKFYHFP